MHFDNAGWFMVGFVVGGLITALLARVISGDVVKQLREAMKGAEKDVEERKAEDPADWWKRPQKKKPLDD
jgi:hypothetical protein